MKIGIPRALPGFLIGDALARFVTALGHEAVWSRPTDERLLRLGETAAPHDLCLPVKVHLGHVLSLAGEVDLVCVPRLVSLDRRSWLCPHFLGLPDTVNALAAGRVPLATAVWNLRRDRDPASGFERLGKTLGAPRRTCAAAARAALAGPPPPLAAPGRLGRVAVLGHPYILGDRLLSAAVASRVAAAGYGVIGVADVPAERRAARLAELARPVFWYSAGEIVGAAFDLLEGGGAAAGVIVVSSFGCGPDSLVRELIEIRARRQGRVPLLMLVVDEHLSAVGLETRLEAFFDMLAAAGVRAGA